MLNPSPSVVTPPSRFTVLYSYPSFKTIFITPAMASDPYCADAPSRKTSTFFRAAAGILFRSTPTSPFPGVSFIYTKALWFFLFPLIKTKVLLGPKPLKSAGSKCAVASDTV